jgi:putative transposase
MLAKIRHRKSYNDPGHAHELTFGCYHGYPFLSKERTCVWLAACLASACRRLHYDLWAHVFMPNHVHIVVHPREVRYDIASFLKQVKNPVSRKALAFVRHESPDWLERLKSTRGRRKVYHFWQRGGGFDRNITEPRTLEKMIDYVHLNPVRKGQVARAADWKWSSAGWFSGEEPNSLSPDRISIEWTVGMSGD